MGLDRRKIKADLCVVGGGIAGINVAIMAARLGLKVVLMHERPVFGGNASGEIRMWICGVKDYAYKETGILEEINMENLFYNPTKNYPLWDSLLYGKVHAEKNITPLLNCTCFDAEMDGDRIHSIVGYQMTTQTFIEVEADYFADCSGDSILAPLSGAEFMYGREAQAEYSEPMHEHQDADKKTMGNSCLLQARKVNKKIPFKAPEWAEKVSVEKLKSKNVNMHTPEENFWYIELGGEEDVISNAESINKRLIALCLGVWDTIKNSGEFDADYFDLEFMGFLGAKRESRRMKGDYVLTANDIMEGMVFDDTVAYGGWPLDDHNPKGFEGQFSNHITPVQKPYGIPYRCLYSKNIKNLFFAGRNISATHMAMSSARVMGTCGIIGQAVGAAAYIAKKHGVLPREVGKYIEELQQLLLQRDCYLPQIQRKVSGFCENAMLIGASDVIRNGWDRDLFGSNNSETIENCEPIKYIFEVPTYIAGVKVVFDSDLKRSTYDMHECEKHHSMRCNVLDDSPIMSMPKLLVKEYEIKIILKDGEEIKLIEEKENKKRNVLLSIEKELKEISLTIFQNWGGESSTRLFTFECFN